MCVVDEKKFRISLKRIPIYKVVLDEGDAYKSPFHGQCFKKEFPIIQHPQQEGEPKYYPGYGFEFGKGFVFATCSLGAAFEVVHHLHVSSEYSREKFSCVILKGYIPAFTRYAISTSRHNMFICARKIVLTKAVTYNL
jgi:hypothetical protein